MRNSLRRVRGRVERFKRYLLVCEGRVTEKFYLSDLRKIENLAFNLEVQPGGVPKSCVERALKLRTQSQKAARSDPAEAYDDVWVMFDVDEHPHVADAIVQARDNNIKVFVSNPCIELWALLHFKDQFAFIDRSDAQRECRDLMPGYEKRLPCEELMNRYDEATRRARHLRQHAESTTVVPNNPFTNVDELIELLRTHRRDWRALR